MRAKNLACSSLAAPPASSLGSVGRGDDSRELDFGSPAHAHLSPRKLDSWSKHENRGPTLMVQELIGLKSNKYILRLLWYAKHLVSAQFRVTSSRNHAPKVIKLSSF